MRRQLQYPRGRYPQVLLPILIIPEEVEVEEEAHFDSLGEPLGQLVAEVVDHSALTALFQAEKGSISLSGLGGVIEDVVRGLRRRSVRGEGSV